MRLFSEAGKKVGLTKEVSPVKKILIRRSDKTFLAIDNDDRASQKFKELTIHGSEKGGLCKLCELIGLSCNYQIDNYNKFYLHHLSKITLSDGHPLVKLVRENDPPFLHIDLHSRNHRQPDGFQDGD